MFYRCSFLKNINLSFFNTNNITNMSFLFAESSSLASIDLSNFNTNNVKDMNGMFDECYLLTKNNVITKDKRILNKLKI